MAYQQEHQQAQQPQQYYQQQVAQPQQYAQQQQQQVQQYHQPHDQIQQHYAQQPQQHQLQQHQPQQHQPQQHQPQQHQPQQQLPPQYAQGQNVANQEWQNSLLDCGPCEHCILGTWLPCVLVGRTADRMRDPTMQTHETFNSECMMMCAITYFGCGWIYAMLKRTEIRERYGIKGDGTADCCATYWCPCCAVIQHDKEVIARTSAGPVAQGYQPNKEGMVMPQQQQQLQHHQQQQHAAPLPQHK